jgi:hypothetical protein
MDEFLAVQASQKPPGTSGWWDRIIPELPDDQRVSLEQAADNRDISHRTISIVLGRWGHKVSPSMVGHWRRNRER